MEVNCDYLESHRKHSKHAVLKGDQVTETVLVASVTRQCVGCNDMTVCAPLSVYCECELAALNSKLSLFYSCQQARSNFRK